MTINTYHREPVLRQNNDGVMVLSPVGRIVAECWKQLPAHFGRVTHAACIVMPKHLHGLLILEAVALPAAAQSDSTIRETGSQSLAEVIRHFKSISTRRVNQLRGAAGARLWQRNYYERIISHPGAFQRVRGAIIANPRHVLGPAR